MGLPQPVDWRVVEEMRAQKLTWKVIGRAVGRNANGLRGRYSERMSVRGEVIAPPAEAWYERTIDVPQAGDDMDAIQAHIATLATLARPALLHITSDEHIGDEDVRALALNIAIGRVLQPDMWIMNGDTFDFPTVSNFAQSRGIQLADALAQVRIPYWRYVEAYHAAAPNTLEIAMSGNHDDRIRKRANEWWQAGGTITDAFAAVIRANGRVLWGGWKQELDVFGLNVRHGERTNIHAAKSTIENDLAYGCSVIFGHTHRFGMWVRTQRTGTRRRVLQAVNVGYGGRNPPAYRQEVNNVDWVWGSCIAHVYTDDWIVNAQPIMYHETARGGMVAFVGTQRVEVDSEGREVA